MRPHRTAERMLACLRRRSICKNCNFSATHTMFKVFETDDFDELADAEELWEIHHRPLRPDKFEGRITVASFGGIGVDRESWSSATEIIGTSPRRAISFVVPCNDTDSYVSCGMDVNAHCIDVFGSQREVHALLRPSTQLISCSISADLLDNGASSTAYVDLAEYGDGHRVVPSTAEATAGLCRLWKQFQKFARVDAPNSGAYDRMIEDILLSASAALSPARKEVKTKARRRYKLARKAREYMRERQSDPPSIAEICSFLNTSERTLHYAFSDLFGISPMRFLKTQRLLAANQVLKRAPVGVRVSEIALRFGFWELGRFARDYRAMFGELPSTTLTGGSSQKE